MESCTCARNCVSVLDNGKLANQEKTINYKCHRKRSYINTFETEKKRLLIADIFMCRIFSNLLNFEGKEEKIIPCNNQVSNSPLKQVFGGLQYGKSGGKRRKFVY